MKEANSVIEMVAEICFSPRVLVEDILAPKFCFYFRVGYSDLGLVGVWEGL